MEVSRELIKEMRAEALARYPKEACGLIVNAGKKFVFVPCENIHEQPEDSFAIDPKGWIRAKDHGDIYAVWHTHPNGDYRPSDVDILSCNFHKLPWLIQSVVTDDHGELEVSGIYSFLPNEEKLPYERRPYIWGVNDCFTLARDFYEREFGILVDFKSEHYPYKENYYEYDLYTTHFQQYGFERVKEDAPLEYGDVLLMCVLGSKPDHAAILLDGNRILHHMGKRLSEITVYGGWYQKHTTYVIRHPKVKEHANKSFP